MTKTETQIHAIYNLMTSNGTNKKYIYLQSDYNNTSAVIKLCNFEN